MTDGRTDRHRRRRPGRTTTTASTPAPASCGTRRSSATATSAPAGPRRPTTSSRSSARPCGRASACSTSAAASAARPSTWPASTAPTSRGSTSPPRWSHIAQERARERGPRTPSPSSSATSSTDFPRPFDVVWSRDALMHIHDKPALFQRLLDLLAPGGTPGRDRLRSGHRPGSPEFQAYVQLDRLPPGRPGHATASCSKRPASSTSRSRTRPRSSSTS